MEATPLTTLLKEKKLITQTQIADAQKEMKSAKTNEDWEAFLLDKKIVTEDQLMEAKGEMLHVPVIDLRNEQIPQDVLALVPEPIAHRHKVISFAKTKSDLSLGMSDPTDIQTKEFIHKKTGLDIKAFLIGPSSFQFGLSKYHSNLEGEMKHLVKEDALGLTASPDKQAGGPDEAGLEKMAEEIPVIRVVDTLLEYAVFEKASDIHIEPQENAVTVRYRIDGILHDVMTLPKVIQAAIVARIKVLANLKIDEHRLPQDGRFKIEKDGYKFSLRVSTIPVFDGEKVVMRLLDESTKAMSLEALGFLPSQLDVVRRNIKRPHGMFLVTGPTGSGKSTTLYAVLTLLNTKSVNISTIEDPVEYRLPGANQMQTNTKIGLTFAIGLRALLRQDPNIIMIGEIRDKETAEEAVHAAMTGHIVLSTLHTNSAAAAPARLLDIGVEPYLITSTTNAILAQRLVRVLCPDCKEKTKPDEALVKNITDQFNEAKIIDVLTREKLVPGKVKSLMDLDFFHGKGCPKCNNSGYKGRIGIHEILEMTTAVADTVLRRASAQETQAQAEKEGMVLMWEDGFIKAIQGMTTVEEILRVSKE
mgnify:CR=1 FL=1